MNDDSEASSDKNEAQKPEANAPKPEANTPKPEAEKPEAPNPETPLKREVFSFTGKAKEYFGIWIVNLLLTLITLSIYGAWAKVRRQRYFYGNTWLDGHNFEYHAKPKQILFGRIIVFGLFMISNLIAAYIPEFWILFLLLIMFLLPWLINKAISFNARVSTYRNVQFGFKGSYWKAFLIYVLPPFLIIFMMMFIYALLSSFVVISHPIFNVQYFLVVFVWIGLICSPLFGIPIISKLAADYIGNGLSYGNAPFNTKARLGSLMSNFALSAVLASLVIILVGFVLWIGYYFVVFDGENIPYQDTATFLLIVFYLGAALSYQFYKAGVRNVVYVGTRLDDKHQLLSSLSRRKYFFIQATNFLVTLLSFGLMRPWAAIRLRRYIVDQTAIDMDGSLDDIVAENEPDGNVVAAEYFDVEGIDFGF